MKEVRFFLRSNEYEENYPFKNGEILLFLGEIENCPGHCAVADKNGKVHWMYHTNNFVEV
jgi:hypothetical protein